MKPYKSSRGSGECFGLERPWNGLSIESASGLQLVLQNMPEQEDKANCREKNACEVLEERKDWLFRLAKKWFMYVKSEN